MVLEVIYVVRHGFRSNWETDPKTGKIKDSFLGPTGIPSDPALAGHGVEQAKELAAYIASLEPRPDLVYSSPFYRCLQTIRPTVEALWPEEDVEEKEREVDGKIRVENGLGEWYGLARFDHPSPAPLDKLHPLFPRLLSRSHSQAHFVPSTHGESIPDIHNRTAYTLHKIISALDADPAGPKALLICTHAATMIAIGRVLTGRMPKDPNEEDFLCYTCSLSKFERRKKEEDEIRGEVEVEDWDRKEPVKIPKVEWKGRGVMGGWECTVNGETSFLSRGAERGWSWAEEKVSDGHPLCEIARRNRESFGEDERNAARLIVEKILLERKAKRGRVQELGSEETYPDAEGGHMLLRRYETRESTS